PVLGNRRLPARHSLLLPVEAAQPGPLDLDLAAVEADLALRFPPAVRPPRMCARIPAIVSNLPRPVQTQPGFRAVFLAIGGASPHAAQGGLPAGAVRRRVTALSKQPPPPRSSPPRFFPPGGIAFL